MEQQTLHPNELRAYIESYVCKTDRFKPDYEHLDTLNLITQFDLAAADLTKQSILVLASRPFSNVNNLNKAQSNVPIEKIIKRGWWMGGNSYVRNESKLQEVRNTFNGPALISNLLPPPSHLMGKLGHPSLQSGKKETWKDVIGKIEAIDSNLPNLFYETITGLDKKSLRREQDRIAAMYSRMKEFAIKTLTSFEEPKKYPGGTMELYKRCFTLYHVKFVRNQGADGVARLTGYKVKWIADYTHKEGGWSKKSDKVTIKLDPYSVLIYRGSRDVEDQDKGRPMTFAGFSEKEIRAQLEGYADAGK